TASALSPLSLRLSLRRPPPSSPLFPYTTLFRSWARHGPDADRGHAAGRGGHRPGGRLSAAARTARPAGAALYAQQARQADRRARSEEHTSELQSRENLVCRLLLEKKKQKPTGTG